MKYRLERKEHDHHAGWPRRPIIYEINTVGVASGAEPAASGNPSRWGPCRRRSGMRSRCMGSMRSGSWVCGSGVRPASVSRTETQDFRPSSAECYRTINGRTMPGLRTVSVATSWTINLADRGVGGSQKDVGRPRHAIDPGFRSEPRRARPSVDHGSSAVFHSRHGRRPDRETGRVFQSGERCALRMAGIRIFLLGRMWLNSTRSVPHCARLPPKRCSPLPSSATGCDAIWPCS